MSSVSVSPNSNSSATIPSSGSETLFRNEDWSSGELLLALVLGGITVVTILGNILLLYLYAKSKRTLRSPTHRLIASLGVADLLVGAGVNPLLITLTFNDWRWNFGETSCHLAQHGHFLLCAVSLLSMTAISIERYVGVRFPLRHKRILTKGRVIAWIILIWVVGFLMTSVPLWIWPSIGGQPGYCKVNLRSHFTLFLSLSLFFIPQTITCITHWQTYKHAVKLYDPEGITKNNKLLSVNSCQSLHSKTSQSPLTDNLTSNSSVRNMQKISEQDRYLDMKQKQTQLAKKLGITVGIMLVLYAPLFSLFLVAGINPKLVRGDVMLVVAWIRYISCTINPFLYIFIVPGYKKAFLKTIWNEISIFESINDTSSKSTSTNRSTKKMLRKKSHNASSSGSSSSSMSTSRSYSEYPSTSETVTSGPTYVNVKKQGSYYYHRNEKNISTISDSSFGDSVYPECTNCGILMTNDLRGDEVLQICAICNIRYNSRLKSFTDVKHLKIVSRPSLEEKGETTITTTAIVSRSKDTRMKKTRSQKRSDVTSGSLVYELRSFLKEMEKKRATAGSEENANKKTEEDIIFQDKASELISNIIKILPPEEETEKLEDKDAGYCKIDKLRRSIVRPISYRRSQILSSMNSSKDEKKAEDLEELKELDDILEIIEKELVSFENLNA